MPVTLVTLLIVALQLSVFSSLRVCRGRDHDRVAVAARDGTCGTHVIGAVECAVVAGVFFDTHAVTPFGLTAVVALALAYGASRLGKEGVGDLDSAAWWVTPLIAAVGGLRRAGALRRSQLLHS